MAAFVAVLCLWGIPDAAQSDEAPLPATTSADAGVPADENTFLRVRPLPEGIDDVQPIPGAANTRFIDCKASWPEGYTANRAKIGSAEYRAKSDIYAYLRALRSFENRDCGCSGKVAPWDGVETIYAALRKAPGKIASEDTAEYSEAADLLEAAVEKLCAGKF